MFFSSAKNSYPFFFLSFVSEDYTWVEWVYLYGYMWKLYVQPPSKSYDGLRMLQYP